MDTIVRRPHRRLAYTALLLTLASTGCGGGPSIPEPSEVARTTSDAEWERLAEPRPEPFPGAARISVALLELPDAGWEFRSDLAPEIGFLELVAAGLLRRQDVHFVERRRFAEAAERERQGLPAPAGAPEIGTSVGAEFLVAGSWSGTALELRLVEVATAEVVTSWRVETPVDADPVGLARAAVGSLLAQLEAMDRRPDWRDPMGEAAPASYLRSEIPAAAVDAFFRGTAAEDRWAWEGALRAYRAALDVAGPDFFEAEVALNRLARLRTGRTLGEG